MNTKTNSNNIETILNNSPMPKPTSKAYHITATYKPIDLSNKALPKTYTNNRVIGNEKYIRIL